MGWDENRLGEVIRLRIALTVLLTVATLGAAACSVSTVAPDAKSTPLESVEEARWIVPRAYEGHCISSVDIEYQDDESLDQINVTGVVPAEALARAIIKGMLQTSQFTFIDVEESVVGGLSIAELGYPYFELYVTGPVSQYPYIVCESPEGSQPSPTPASSFIPERGVLSIASLDGLECYTGKSSSYWDDTRVVLELRVENLGKSKSMKVWVRAKTERGGPVSKPRGMQNLKFEEDLGVYGENAPTSIAFSGIAIGPGKRVTFRWSADYFWAPGAVYVELWNGAPGSGEGQQGAASYVLDSSSPQNGLKSCSRY